MPTSRCGHAGRRRPHGRAARRQLGRRAHVPPRKVPARICDDPMRRNECARFLHGCTGTRVSESMADSPAGKAGVEAEDGSPRGAGLSGVTVGSGGTPAQDTITRGSASQPGSRAGAAAHGARRTHADRSHAWHSVLLPESFAAPVPCEDTGGLLLRCSTDGGSPEVRRAAVLSPERFTSSAPHAVCRRLGSLLLSSSETKRDWGCIRLPGETQAVSQHADIAHEMHRLHKQSTINLHGAWQPGPLRPAPTHPRMPLWRTAHAACAPPCPAAHAAWTMPATPAPGGARPAGGPSVPPGR